MQSSQQPCFSPHAYVEESDLENFGKLRNVDPTITTMMEQYYGQELATAYNKWLDGFSSVYTDPVRQGDIL